MYRVFLAAALLACCTGESSVHGPPEKVLASAGGDVILPCSFSITASDDFPTVEWSKKDLQPDVVFLYQNHCETYAMKNPAFKYRTSLIMEELQNRNVSLRISNVQLSDAGRYQCKRIWGNAPHDITTVELVVGAVSEPKLSVMISAESGGVTLQCEADCWLSEPEITFLDDRGNSIPADEQRRREDVSGCCTVSRRVTLQDASSRVTCRVHQPEINQTRDTHISIPVHYIQSCFLTAGIAVGLVLLLVAALGGLTVFLWKRCGKCAGQKLPVSRQSSDQSRVSSTSGNQPLLQSVRAETADNRTIQKLTRDVADLKSKLQEKEDTIRQLQNNNKPQQSPVVCHLDQPTIACSPAASTNSHPPAFGSLPQNQGPKPGISQQNSTRAPGRPIPGMNRANSSPAVLSFDDALCSSSSANTSKKKLGDIRRCKSESAQPRPNIPKLQRRHSFAPTLSTLSNNRFTPLANLSEEAELLVP
ncbi:butyrophilin subfamily 3 member A2-like [Siniperca chuatsi]|uniref:butyrophilin subfamily 3 member A2-like n=1 Tax=Siniperca chuatsi TaxID=119488 RepID=UPI001CE16452|nr:butyrophilin subfamily 3 member A2-like [Siniperca chuatsi]